LRTTAEADLAAGPGLGEVEPAAWCAREPSRVVEMTGDNGECPVLATGMGGCGRCHHPQRGHHPGGRGHANRDAFSAHVFPLPGARETPCNQHPAQHFRPLGTGVADRRTRAGGPRCSRPPNKPPPAFRSMQARSYQTCDRRIVPLLHGVAPWLPCPCTPSGWRTLDQLTGSLPNVRR
jgi:hypothetical protein